MSTPTVISTESRTAIGSRSSRRERSRGRVPVNLYGHGQGNVALTVSAHELEIAFHTAAQVFMLDIGGQQESCLIKEVQYDTFGQYVLHVDFSRIDLGEEVSVEVQLEFRGDAVGVLAGGTQIVHHAALPVRCRADSIPDVLVVDVSAIEIGHAIDAGEVSLPAGVTLDEDELAPTEPVVGVAAPRVEEEAEPAEGEEGAAAAGEGEGAEGEAKAKADDKSEDKGDKGGKGKD